MKALLLIFLLGTSLQTFSQEAKELAALGRYREAADAFQLQAETASAKTDHFSAAKALLNAANCLKMDGNLTPALMALSEADQLAEEHNLTALRGRLLATRGSILSLGKYPSRALKPLEQAAHIAYENGDSNLYLEARNDAGIAASSAGKYQIALDHFNEVEQLARQAGREDLRLRARQNHLIASFQLWQESRLALARIQEVDGYDGPALSRLQEHEQQFENSLRQSQKILTESSPAHLNHAITTGLCAVRYGDNKTGFDILKRALTRARRSNSPDLLCSALTTLAELYLDHHRPADARLLLSDARGLEPQLDPASKAHLDVLRARTDHTLSPASPETGRSIERAIASGRAIRSDLARSQNISDLGRTFRQHAGQPYLLLADHHLRQTPPAPEKAREAIELFKRWELDDFFRDNCINIALQSARDLRRLEEPGVGILYLIPLEQETSVLLTTSSGTTHWTASLGADELYRLARILRNRLEFDYGTYSFKPHAETLYTHLLAPGETHLQSLQHLVIVPDGPLGNIPFACLLNPKTGRYLLETHSLSLAPSLELLSSGNTLQNAKHVVLGGMSLAVEDFVALPGVRQEVESLQALYASEPPLLDKLFTADSLRKNIQDPAVNIVHLGTHGEFGGRAEDSFLLVHGARDGQADRLSLDQLEELIRPKKYRGNPVDLLCLSACRTARGNDRAALGLAGAAVKSGSRSVAATLWYVDDQSSTAIITDFHRHYLHGQSKATALRTAQLAFLNTHRHTPKSHPYHWAPFVLIGDWH